jgi:hypothetical protein
VRRLVGFLVLILALAGLAGCSGARLAYNNADTVVRWMADDYFGFEGAQEQDFKARLARFHAWHRAQELPRYSALMASAGEKLSDGLTSEELLWAWENVKLRYRTMAVHVVPDLAAVLVTLTPEQFERLDRKFADTNAEFAKKHIEGGETAQRKRRHKRNLELMRDWFGDLSDEQEALVKAWGERMPLLYEMRLKNRQRRQAEFVALLKQYRSATELEPRLRLWLADWDKGAAPEYLRLSGAHQEQYVQMLLELDRGITPAQRAHAVDRMNHFAEIFKALAENGKPAPPSS